MVASVKSFIKLAFAKPEPKHNKESLDKLINNVKDLFPSASVHNFSDQEIESINESLRWNAFTIDSKGRKIGKQHNGKKRSSFQAIPDYRILKLKELIGLKDRSVLEIGCFEAIHSLGLAAYSKKVLGIDSHIENVIKSVVRSNLYGARNVDFRVHDIEKNSLGTLGTFDLVFHCGVFYHLIDPLKHLNDLALVCGDALFLDTHVSSPGDETVDYKYKNKTYAVKKFRESGYGDVFSGMSNHSLWLSENDLVSTLKDVGFSEVNVLERRDERAGLRLAILARKKHSQ